MTKDAMTIKEAKDRVFEEHAALQNARDAAFSRAKSCLLQVFQSVGQEPQIECATRTETVFECRRGQRHVVMTALGDGRIEVSGGTILETVDTVCGADDAMKALVRALFFP